MPEPTKYLKPCRNEVLLFFLQMFSCIKAIGACINIFWEWIGEKGEKYEKLKKMILDPDSYRK